MRLVFKLGRLSCVPTPPRCILFFPAFMDLGSLFDSVLSPLVCNWETFIFILQFIAVKIILPADSCYVRAANHSAMEVLASLEPSLKFMPQSENALY